MCIYVKKCFLFPRFSLQYPPASSSIGQTNNIFAPETFYRLTIPFGNLPKRIKTKNEQPPNLKKREKSLAQKLTLDLRWTAKLDRTSKSKSRMMSQKHQFEMIDFILRW